MSSTTSPRHSPPTVNCDSCRRAHAAPLYQVVAIRQSHHTITEGADLIREFQRPGKSIVRAFCSVCGTRIYNRFTHVPPERSPLVFFPDLIEEAQRKNLPVTFQPKINNAAGECVLDAEKLAEVLGD